MRDRPMTDQESTHLPAPDRRRLARNLFDRLRTGEFTAAHAMLDSSVRDALPVSHLRRKWDDLAPGESELREITPIDDTGAAVHFDRDGEQFRIDVSFGTDGSVRTLFFERGDAPRRDSYVPPTYVDPDLRREKVEFTVGSATLTGELVRPPGSDPLPTMVLLPGTGASGAGAGPGASRPLQDLAHGVASTGFAAVRYNKRPVPPDGTSDRPLVSDAREVVSETCSLDRVDSSRVVVCGHSLGGFIAPEVCAGTAATRAVMLGAPCGNLLETAVDQVDSPVTVDQFRGIVAGSPDNKTLLGYPAAFWRDVEQRRPARLADRENLDVFVGYGGRDDLISEASFEHWIDVLDPDLVTAQRYPALTHVLLPATDEHVNGADQRHVPKRVVDDVSRWLSTPPIR